MTDRYSRQILFSPIGKEGQKKLAESNAVIIGCGALGTVIATILVRAGVGKSELSTGISLSTTTSNGKCFLMKMI